MTVNQKEVDSEHVLSSISEMTSVIGSGIPKRKFQIYSLQSTDADNCKLPITKFCQKLIKTVEILFLLNNCCKQNKIIKFKIKLIK